MAKIRTTIAEHPDEWAPAAAFLQEHPEYQLGSDSLKRPPRGFDPVHPLINDLKRKDFYAEVYFDESTVCRDDFLSILTATCQTMAPLMRFLYLALDLPW